MRLIEINDYYNQIHCLPNELTPEDTYPFLLQSSSYFSKNRRITGCCVISPSDSELTYVLTCDTIINKSYNLKDQIYLQIITEPNGKTKIKLPSTCKFIEQCLSDIEQGSIFEELNLTEFDSLPLSKTQGRRKTKNTESKAKQALVQLNKILEVKIEDSKEELDNENEYVTNHTNSQSQEPNSSLECLK